MRRVKKLMFYMLGSRYQESPLKEYVGGNWQGWLVYLRWPKCLHELLKRIKRRHLPCTQPDLSLFSLSAAVATIDE